MPPSDQAPEPATVPVVARLHAEALAELAACPASPAALDHWREQHLGRGSALAACRSRIGALPRAERADVGRRLSATTTALTGALDARLAVLTDRPAPDGPVPLRLDPTCPPPPSPLAGPHPVTELTEAVVGHFARLGFSRVDSTQLEDVAHSFDLLGVPADHPTRSHRHTFFTTDGAVLRSHLTASTLRQLRRRAGGGATRFVVDGPCHRNTVPGPRFVTQFHQVEAVATGPGVRVSDLKGLALGLVDEVLDGVDSPRLRHRSLPYVSPGFAVDVDCRPCATDGCGLCLGSGRLEVMSGGLLTPDVLRAGGVPPGHRGLALAVSLERILAVRHRLGDIRHFLRNDLRVLAQFH